MTSRDRVSSLNPQSQSVSTHSNAMSLRAMGDVTIRRAVMPADIAAVRACFIESHDTLPARTLTLALHTLVRAWEPYAALLAATALVCWALLRFGVIESHAVVWAGALVCATLLGVTYLVLQHMAVSGWQSMTAHVTRHGDMSDALCEAVYNDPRNVCLIAEQRFASPDTAVTRVIGSASVLTGEHAERFRTQRKGGSDDPLCGRVTRVGVLPAAHGKGVGKKLVSALLRWAKEERGLTALRLITSTPQAPAVALYTGLGFTERDRVTLYRLFGIHELTLERQL